MGRISYQAILKREQDLEDGHGLETIIRFNFPHWQGREVESSDTLKEIMINDIANMAAETGEIEKDEAVRQLRGETNDPTHWVFNGFEQLGVSGFM